MPARIPDGRTIGHVSDAPRWNLGHRLLFRFTFLYFGLYFFPFPLSVFGLLAELPPPLSWIGAAAGWLGEEYGDKLNGLALWTGRTLLGLTDEAMPIQPTGSGDTMISFVQAVTGLWLALVGTLIWSIADRHRPAYPRLERGLRVYLRYALATVLLSYGFAKVPPMQFPKPGPELLVQTYGESSPMGLLWRFMGFSPIYTMFAGFAEILPGLLLLFRRTTALGALIAIATMTNVVMLNFCYDVPVKLYSAHLLATAALILVPDVRRLADALVLGRAVPSQPPMVRRFPRTLAGSKAVFLLLLVGGQIYGAYASWQQYGPSAARPPLYGVWEVESFTLEGEPRPPLLTDEARWRRFMVSRWGGAIVQQMGSQVNRFTLKQDDPAGTITLASRGDAGSYTLDVTQPDPGRLVLEGPFREGRVRVELRRTDDASFPIDTRGFHWVQEFPYNR